MIRHILRSLAVMMLALSAALHPASLLAQESDLYNTDFMYLYSPDKMPEAFNNSDEWTISFACQDTMQQQYHNPVMMSFATGDSARLRSIAIQDLDSILMYEPVAQLRSGIFEFTEEYYPYMTAADHLGKDSAWLVFNKEVSLDLSMPNVGDRVASHIYRRPTKAGLVGIVTKIWIDDDKLYLAYRPDWEQMMDYYVSFAHEFSVTDFLDDREDSLGGDSVPQLSPVRTRVKDGDWSGNLDYDNRLYEYILDEETSIGALTVTPDIHFWIDMKVNVWLDGQTHWRGFRVEGGLDAGASVDVKGDLDLPKYKWMGLPDKFKKYSEYVDLGVYLKAKLSGHGHFEVKGYNPRFDFGLSKQYNQNNDAISDWKMSKHFSHPGINSLTPTAFLTLSGEVTIFDYEIAIKVPKDVPLVSGKIDIELGIPKVAAKFDLAAYYPNSTPEEVIDAGTNFIYPHTEIKVGATFDAKCDLKLSVFGGDDKKEEEEEEPDYSDASWFWYSQLHRADLNKSYIQVPRPDSEAPSTDLWCYLSDYVYPEWFVTKEAFYCVSSSISVPFYLWVWDVDAQRFIAKESIGKFGTLDGKFNGLPYRVNVPKGGRYKVLPVIDGTLLNVGNNHYGSLGFLKDKDGNEIISTPYYVRTLDVLAEFENLARGEFDKQAVLDNQDPTHRFYQKLKYGFEYTESFNDIKTTHKTVGTPLLSERYHSLPIKDLEENKEYKIRAFIETPEGKIYGEVVLFSSGISIERPYTKTVIESGFDYLTFEGLVSDDIYEMYLQRGSKIEEGIFQPGFDYTVKEHFRDDRQDDGHVESTWISGEHKFTATAYNLLPNTRYVYRAFLYHDGLRWAGLPERFFYTADPYQANTLFEFEPSYFSARVHPCEWIEWMFEHAKDPGNSLEASLIYGKDRTDVYNTKVDEPLPNGVKMVPITDLSDPENIYINLTGLSSQTEYHTRVIGKFTHARDGVHKFHGPLISSFTTLNPWEVTTLPCVEPEFYDIVLSGKMTDYMAERYNTAEYAINCGFQYAFEEKGVTGEQGHQYVAVADLDPATGKFTFDTRYQLNQGLIALGKTFYYRAFAEVNGKMYYGRILKQDVPDIYHVTTGEYEEFDDYLSISGQTHEGIYFLSQQYDIHNLYDNEGNIIDKSSVPRHVVKTWVEYAENEDDLDDETKLELVEGELQEDGSFSCDVYEMEYNTHYYYRTGMCVDDIYVWGETRELTTADWDPDLSVDARRPDRERVIDPKRATARRWWKEQQEFKH